MNQATLAESIEDPHQDFYVGIVQDTFSQKIPFTLFCMVKHVICWTNGLWEISRNWNRVRICRFPPFYVSCFGYCIAPQNKEPFLGLLKNLT